MELSIITVNYRCWDHLRAALDGLTPATQLQEGRWEIIVVDNGSTDDSISILESKLGSLIDLIASPQNLGFAGGNNLAIQHALKSGADWLLRVLRSGEHRELARTALFWLGQSEDPRAFAELERLLD